MPKKSRQKTEDEEFAESVERMMTFGTVILGTPKEGAKPVLHKKKPPGNRSP